MDGQSKLLGFFDRKLGDSAGVGPQTQKLLNHLGLHTNRDLLWHLPVRVESFPLTPLHLALNGQSCTVRVRVSHTILTRNMLRVVVEEASGGRGALQIVFFKGRLKELESLFKQVQGWFFSGTLSLLDGVLSLVHPVGWGRIEKGPPSLFQVIYPLTKGLGSPTLQRLVQGRLRDLPDMPEWLPDILLPTHGWPSFSQALGQVHCPQKEADLSLHAPGRQRLAFDELLAHQLMLLQGRLGKNQKSSPPLQGTGENVKKVLATAGFCLTSSQQKALGEIYGDLEKDVPMARLLQGDVGSGKTILALLAIARATEAGFQAVFLAPTEILAQQQGEKAQKLFEETGVTVALLTRTTPQKKKLLHKISSGEVQVVVGTHAVFQEAVGFAKLGLVIIDEQHRFGVAQRLQIAQKGLNPHMLIMSATPIPRTLEMTLFADLDVSVLNEKPGGRQGIETFVIPASRIHEVKDFMAQHLQGGGQVYWVCPLIEATDENGPQGAKGACVSDRFQDLQAVFQGRVGVVHGQQKGEEKRAVLEAFRSQKIQILVSTTVIEVGVDVPEATLMVIESAQQFGLAQLHQLRGRVGRGGAKSYCFLIYSYPLSDVGKQRLQAIKKSNDGFWIAEQDWRLRGGGDLLGVRQSGLPLFAFADLSVHRDLLEKAHTFAQQILKSDPLLEGKEGRPWDMLLHLFRKKREAVDLLSSA